MSVDLPTDDRVLGIDAAVDYLEELQKRGIHVVEWAYEQNLSGEQELYSRVIRAHDAENLAEEVASNTVGATATTREEELEHSDKTQTVHVVQIDGCDREIVVTGGSSYDVRHVDYFANE